MYVWLFAILYVGSCSFIVQGVGKSWKVLLTVAEFRGNKTES